MPNELTPVSDAPGTAKREYCASLGSSFVPNKTLFGDGDDLIHQRFLLVVWRVALKLHELRGVAFKLDLACEERLHSCLHVHLKEELACELRSKAKSHRCALVVSVDELTSSNVDLLAIIHVRESHVDNRIGELRREAQEVVLRREARQLW